MRNYWTCSKFADWLRGTAKPYAETADGWNTWTRNAKAAHPFRYWLADTGLDAVQKAVYYVPNRLRDVKYYINNRFITQTHVLKAHPRDIKRGTWQDVGHRFLPCMFNELQDFVEVELAWWHLVWAGSEDRAKYKAPWWNFGWWNLHQWRCPQAGLDNLDWQRKLVFDDEWISPNDPKFGKPTPQATNAQEILDLYTWWTVVRPARRDPMDLSGWSDVCDRRRANDDNDDIFMSDDRTPEEAAESKHALDLCNQLEQEYEQEDEDMMIRLIKIRSALWT